MKNDIKQYPKHRTVHHVLARSYIFYFLVLIVGIFLDFKYPIKIFENNEVAPFGMIVILFATILIFWAQHTSRNLEREKLTKESFCKGPYCYTRTPTHFGLLLLIMGFGIAINAFFVFIFTLFSFIFTRLIFVRNEEKLLVEKYGEPYKEYKKSVKF